MKLVDVAHISEANAITHAGAFHADDVLAAAVLDIACENLVICRANSLPSIVPSNAIVFDIGGGCYDHHQRGGNGARDNGVPYASAGLIWRDFGLTIVSDSCDPFKAWKCLDREFVQGVDAVDNGLFSRAELFEQLTFSGIVKAMNPLEAADSTVRDEAFSRAVRFARETLEGQYAQIEHRLRCADEVEQSIRESKDGVLELSRPMPWKETLFSSANIKARQLFFVVYPSERGGYNWQRIPWELESNASGITVPKSWWGLAGEHLREVSGVLDAEFCHASGFLGAALSRAGAFEMVRIAMSLKKNI